jgi:hypothetical protein
MRKHSFIKVHNRQDGVAQLSIVALVVMVLAVIGLAVWQSQHVKSRAYQTSGSHTSTSVAQASSTPAPSATATPTDLQLITAVVRTNCEKKAGTLKYAAPPTEIQGDSAHVTVACGTGGYSDILKKLGSEWVIVYEGQQPPDKATGEKYDLPASWY